MSDYEWENQEWLEEFKNCLTPEYFMWRDKANRDQAIKELLNGNA